MPNEALLEPMLVGDISGDFFVPSYQRGYRWGSTEVTKLLDDVWESRDKTYYLQPVVVKQLGDRWELVDGQQRLTTLYLIFQYMKLEGLQSSGASYTISYGTRRDSAAYLYQPDLGRSQDNIDFFHIYEAYRCIAQWFESHGHRRQFVANEFYGALFKQVKIIWYEASDGVDAAALFTRLNVGRIPLTDAELVKALLLSRAHGVPGATDHTLEIAAQWDSIERDLREPELWAFITGRANEEPTHISLLLDTLADGPAGRDRPLFHTFDTLRERITEDPEAFWELVVDLHSLIVGWFQDRDLFHKIGFLVAGGTSLSELVRRYLASQTRSQFQTTLDLRIRESLRLSEEGLRELSYQSAASPRVLLLMNVETVRCRKYSTERYSFREHAGGRWSLEHIHAQNAEPLNRAEQWKAWLALQSRALSALDEIDPARARGLLARAEAALDSRTLKEVEFRALERDFISVLSAKGEPGEGEMDSIANLALLHGSDNSALSNSVFAVKRAEILERDRRGSYIPVCTRNVFLKYYSPAAEQQLHFWSEVDRRHYLDAIVDAVRPYLTPEEVVS